MTRDSRGHPWLRRLGSRRALVRVCVLLGCGVSANAHAFRLPVNFNQSAAVGGGGGRYFTGSPSDRYTCKVCHTGSAAPALQVSGLPLAGYVPGQTYQIFIDWDDTLPSVAFNLEMTDGAGHAFGTFSVPPLQELAPGELCSGATALVVVPGSERTMALLTECGAKQSTIRWTAPAATVDATGMLTAPQAWFSGSLVASNKDGSVDGDGVIDVSHVIGASGQVPPPATTISGGCSVAARVPRSSHGGWVVSLLFLGWFRRGRKAVS